MSAQCEPPPQKKQQKTNKQTKTLLDSPCDGAATGSQMQESFWAAEKDPPTQNTSSKLEPASFITATYHTPTNRLKGKQGGEIGWR